MSAIVEVPPVVICRYCLQRMQIADEVITDGVVTSRRFICACRGTIFQSNFHRHKTELDKK